MNKPSVPANWKLLYESLFKSSQRMISQIEELKKSIAGYEQKEKQWALEKSKQNEIFQGMLNGKNKEHNEILEENARLREELKRIRG